MLDAMLDPPPPWTNQRIVVYHGTLDVHGKEILRSGVNVGTGRVDRDFGRGFYTTPVRQQADDWAWRLARQSGGLNRRCWRSRSSAMISRILRLSPLCGETAMPGISGAW